MFDLNIDHYTKNELEDLFDLDSKVYSNVDLEKNLASLKKKIELEGDIDSQTKEKTLNFLLTAKELLLDKSPNILTTNIIEQGENFIIEKPKQRPIDVGTTDEPYYRGTLNPMQRRTTEVLVNVDSRFRDDQKSLSTDFTISFPNLIKNVISMQVKTVEEITGFFQISDKLKNNYFHYNTSPGAALTRVIIPDGNYTVASFVSALNNELSGFTNTNDKLSFDGSGSKYYFYFNKLFNGDDDQLPNLRQKLGWIMGHTEEELIADTTVDIKNNIQLTRVNYANLVVDDFQNNFYQSIINGTNSYIQNSNLLTRIGNVNSLKVVQNDSPERKYFGPVDIQKLKIQLVDEYGRIVDLNGNEFSFSILLKCQYDM